MLAEGESGVEGLTVIVVAMSGEVKDGMGLAELVGNFIKGCLAFIAAGCG